VGQVLVIAVLMAGLLLTLVTTPVRAHSPGGETVVARYGTTPDVNGIIAAGEWTDASTVTFSGITVYVKQDGSHLYVAFDIPDTAYYDYDEADVYLDVEHNGGTAPLTDDLQFTIRRDGSTYEFHGTGPPLECLDMAHYRRLDCCLFRNRRRVANRIQHPLL